MSATRPVKVSVIILTYNHEPFIAQALDGALMQQTDFEYEILIGEDCSGDNTRTIIVDYEKRYPDRFRLFLNERNLGAYKNCTQILEACRGEYIAVLEGDDYWTSPHKLQMQVGLLDKHPELVMCFHNVKIVYEDESNVPHTYCSPNQKAVSNIEDLLGHNFIPTCSKMFRNGVVKNLPEWVSLLPMGDWPSNIFLAQHGQVGYISEVMGTYRIHAGGMWYGMRQDLKNWYKAEIDFYEMLYRHFYPKYSEIIAAQLKNRCFRLSEEYLDINDLPKARKYFAKCISLGFLRHKKLCQMLVRLHAPKVYCLLRSLKRVIYNLKLMKQRSDLNEGV
jgi:glycosyltransferase involved in cell wall biosynthesis